jgi:hypothetical protein
VVCVSHRVFRIGLDLFYLGLIGVMLSAAPSHGLDSESRSLSPLYSIQQFINNV